MNQTTLERPSQVRPSRLAGVAHFFVGHHMKRHESSPKALALLVRIAAGAFAVLHIAYLSMLIRQSGTLLPGELQFDAVVCAVVLAIAVVLFVVRPTAKYYKRIVGIAFLALFACTAYLATFVQLFIK